MRVFIFYPVLAYDRGERPLTQFYYEYEYLILSIKPAIAPSTDERIAPDIFIADIRQYYTGLPKREFYDLASNVGTDRLNS